MEKTEQKEGGQQTRTSPSPSTPPPMRKSKLVDVDAGDKQQTSIVSSSCSQSNTSCAKPANNLASSTSIASCATYPKPTNNSASKVTNGGGFSSSAVTNHKSNSNNKSISKSAIAKSNNSKKSSSQSHSGSAGTTGSGGGAGTGSSNNSSPSGDSKADTEEEDDQHPGEGAGSLCECVQCEVCMAENWWRMAAFQNSLLQQQGGSPHGLELSESAATGLDLIGSAASLMLSQQRASTANGGSGSGMAAEEMFRADFSIPKLLEFFECQKSMGIPNFPEDFDEFWLLVVKARLFNIFKYRGPEAYNRVVLKIRNIVRHFREELEIRERQNAAAAAMTAIITGKEAIGIATELVAEKKGSEEKTAAAIVNNNKMVAGNGSNNNKTTKKQQQVPQKKASS